jgi:hypothetical protein
LQPHQNKLTGVNKLPTSVGFFFAFNYVMISFHDSCCGDDDADAQPKFSVPLVPQCSVMTEQEKRLQVIVFKGVFLIYI